MSDGLRIEIRPAAAIAAPLRAAWDDLAAAASTPNPFYEAMALLPAQALPEAAPARLLLAWRGAALDGLLPVATRRAGPLALAVENWSQRVRALGEPLVRAGAETDFWRAALPALAREPGRYLRLSALDAGSASTEALRALLAGRGVALYETRRYGRALLRGGTSSAAHLAAHVRGKVLKEHRRLRARLAERGELAFERLGREEDAAPWIDTLFRLEESGWKGRDGVAASADPRTERCFRTILGAAHAAGRLDFHRMRVGDRVISMLANIEAGDEAFQLKIAHDEAWAAFSPGVLVEMHYLAYALDARGIARADSCARAGHPMIDRIWAERRPIVSLAVPLAKPGSRLVCAVADRLRRRRTAS